MDTALCMNVMYCKVHGYCTVLYVLIMITEQLCVSKRADTVNSADNTSLGLRVFCYYEQS